MIDQQKNAGEEPRSIDPNLIAWFIEENEEHTSGPIVRCWSEFSKHLKSGPKWYYEMHERDARYGFRDGVRFCIELIDELYGKGFLRPNEIRNILSQYEEETLHRWVHDLSIQGDNGEDYPALEIDPWLKIRKRILARDEDKCTVCGAVSNLEIHHIVSVRNGGTPYDSNLTTLCASCHVLEARK